MSNRKKKPKTPTPEVEMTEVPCPRCLKMAKDGQLRPSMVQPLPFGAYAPLAKKPGGGPCCFDCASADTLVRLDAVFDFGMARVAIGNDREEQYRLPGVCMGLVAQGLARPSKPGDFEAHLRWLKNNHHFGIGPNGDEHDP